MKEDDSKSVLTCQEIGALARKLTPKDQTYIVNTLNALLFSQQIKSERKES